MRKKTKKVKGKITAKRCFANGAEYEVYFCGDEILLRTDDVELHEHFQRFGCAVSGEEANEIIVKSTR